MTDARSRSSRPAPSPPSSCTGDGSGP
jgi:hypothetical protein